MQQQSRKSTNRSADVRMARVADRDGLHSSEEHGGTEDFRHGVLVVSNASASRYQTRVRRVASVGGHFGDRSFQGKYIHSSYKIIPC